MKAKQSEAIPPGKDGPWELPASWRWVPLGTLGEFINGAAFKPTDWSEDGIPIIRIQNLNDADRAMNRTKRIVDDRFKVTNGDLLVSWSATLDAFLWQRDDAWLNQHIFKVNPIVDLVDRRFLFFLLKNEIENLKKTEHLHGSTMMHINRGPFLAHLVPLPPLETQVQVARSIDELFTDIEDGEAALALARSDLAIWRKSLLKAAVTGDLTADWRAANPPTETGADLLVRILAERRAQWERELKNKGKRYLEPEAPEFSELSELPKSWRWVSVAQIAKVTGGVTKHHKRDDHGLRLPYLRVGNVYDGRLDLTRIETIGLVPSEEARVNLAQGDLLIVEGNGSLDQIGRSAIWTGEIERCVHQNHLIKVRASMPEITRFLQIWLQSLGGRKELEEKASSTSGLHTLSISKVNGLRFPLPPLPEIKRIIVELDHMSRDHEEAVDSGDDLDAASATLRQSILAAAFSGKLVA